MKRGLKAFKVPGTDGCYNRYPDEKGTESKVANETVQGTESDPEFTTVTPMKRGLKGQCDCPMSERWCGYNRFPDEKGTERPRPVLDQDCGPLGYNRYPDEKGTESTQFEQIAVQWLQPLPR